MQDIASALFHLRAAADCGNMQGIHLIEICNLRYAICNMQLTVAICKVPHQNMHKQISNINMQSTSSKYAQTNIKYQNMWQYAQGTSSKYAQPNIKYQNMWQYARYLVKICTNKYQISKYVAICKVPHQNMQKNIFS